MEDTTQQYSDGQKPSPTVVRKSPSSQREQITSQVLQYVLFGSNPVKIVNIKGSGIVTVFVTCFCNNIYSIYPSILPYTSGRKTTTFRFSSPPPPPSSLSKPTSPSFIRTRRKLSTIKNFNPLCACLTLSRVAFVLTPSSTGQRGQGRRGYFCWPWPCALANALGSYSVT